MITKTGPVKENIAFLLTNPGFCLSLLMAGDGRLLLWVFFVLTEYLHMHSLVSTLSLNNALNRLNCCVWKKTLYCSRNTSITYCMCTAVALSQQSTSGMRCKWMSAVRRRPQPGTCCVLKGLVHPSHINKHILVLKYASVEISWFHTSIVEVNQNEFVVRKTLQNGILSRIRELDTLDNLQNTL